MTNISPGATAYATRQSVSWLGRAVVSEKEFKLANPDHVTIPM